ncbi:DUF5804 family protein [Halococcus dombrowskii]|uniref:DUF5804 family protein n=1 Tax=Halococcus dombrowskii TaxID=179637 RepID=A0AAV3SGT8_HALDO
MSAPVVLPAVTQVCLVGGDCDIRYELLSRETARRALSTYDLTEPYTNTLSLSTVSLGAAVSLLNDLNWYLVRFASDALVRDPSISDTEWLSRPLAEAIRDGRLQPDETDDTYRIYPIEDGALAAPSFASGRDAFDHENELVVRVTEDEYEG